MAAPDVPAYLAYLPDAARCGIHVYSLRDRRNESVNPAYTAITGRGLAEVQATGEGFRDLIHPDDRAAIDRHIEILCDGPLGQAQEITYRFRHQRGHWIWCAARNVLVERAADGAPVRLLGTFIDISGQKVLERELSESQERLTLAAEAGKIGIWDWNMQTGRSTNDRRVHEQFDMPWGSPDDAELWFSRMHPDDISAVKAAVESALAGSGDYTGRYRVRWRDGSIHHLMAKGMVIRDATGAPQRLLGMNIDITELVELQQRVEQRQKMEAIGQLAGGIAHDFNNQLMAVLGNAELLLGLLVDARQRRYVGSIITAANRSADLTRQLLNYARRGVTRHTRFPLAKVIDEVVDILSHSIDKRIAIRLDHPAEPVVIDGDESNLQSALLNLALNARDAMPDGGTLVFTTTVVEVDDAMRSGDLADLVAGRYVRVAVSDTGVGIPAALLARVREPFFTTKAVGAGTGLGLAAADGIAQRHGGVLTITSEVGRGTTMTMYLPYPVLTDLDIAAVTQQPPRNKQLSVLVIDDEPAVIDLLQALLTDDGHRVHGVTDPLAGIAHVQAHSHEIDLILLDMTMPQLNGVEVFERIRTISPQVPVLIISGHSPEGAVANLLARGGVAFLQKPFSVDQLRVALVGIAD